MFRRQPVACCPVVSSASLADNGSYVCLAKPSSRLSQRVEDCLQIERRPADGLQHIGGGRLLLERLPQFAEQLSVLDCDHGLSGEVRHQLNLLFGERAYFLAVNRNRTHQLILLQHRHVDDGPEIAKLDA
jgi:hypothetical protein